MILAVVNGFEQFHPHDQHLLGSQGRAVVVGGELRADRDRVVEERAAVGERRAAVHLLVGAEETLGGVQLASVGERCAVFEFMSVEEGVDIVPYIEAFVERKSPAADAECEFAHAGRLPRVAETAVALGREQSSEFDVEIEEGVEGLVHVSEMDWTNKNIHPSKVVNVGDVVEVMVLDIDEERRRISLGLKQCKANPWQQFAETHNKGDRVEGKIKSITDFGIFIGLDGGIDGLVHLSDISWNVAGEEAVREYKKGDEIAAVVLQVDAERERISLGVKQLAEDPFNNWVALNKKGAIVTGKVTAVDAKGATVELADGVEGYLRASEASRDRVEDATLVLSVGDEVEAKFTGVDRKNRAISLSVRAKDEADEKDAIATVNKQEDANFSNNAMAEAFKAAKGE